MQPGEAIQFIPERPDRPRVRDVRARSITSCDNCRRRKQRCNKPNFNEPCTSCATLGVPCSFGDRELYWDRMLHSQSAPVPSVVAEPSPGQMQPPASAPPVATGHRGEHEQRPRIMTRGLSTIPAVDPLLTSSEDHDLVRLMPALIQSFGSNCYHEFSFMDHDQLLLRYETGRMSALECYSIAAHAIPYNGVPMLHGQDIYMLAQHYAYKARAVLNRELGSFPSSIRLLNVLLLVAWMEYKSSRLPEFRAYTQLAFNMAQDLGLSSGAMALSAAHDQAELDRLRAAWTNILRLQYTADALHASSA